MENYIKSSKIKVFPTSYRNHSIDPESYLNTEKNLTSLKMIGGTHYENFIDQKPIYDGNNVLTDYELTIYLKGYRFQVLKSDILALGLGNVDIYAGIKLVTDNIVYNSNPNNNTFASKRLDNIESTGSKLDNLDNSSTSTFQGLKFGDLNTFVGQGFDAYIKVLEYSDESGTTDWSVPSSSRIRVSADEVSSGSDDDMSLNQRLWTGEIHFAAGINGTIDGISDTPTNSSTTAASVKAVKTLSDQKLDANGFSTSGNKLAYTGDDFVIDNGSNDVSIEGGVVSITSDTSSIVVSDDGSIELSGDGTHSTGLFPSTTTNPSITLPSISGNLALEGNIANSWSTSTTYYIGDYIYYNSNLYRCKTQHTSGNTFDSTKFDLVKLSQTKLDANGFSTSYNASSYKSKLYNDDNITIQANGAIELDATSGSGGYIYLGDDGLIGASSDGGHYVTEMSFSKESNPGIYFPISSGKLALEGGIANNWSSAASYNVGNYVYYKSSLYRCKTSHTSGLTFDSTKFDAVKLSQTKLDKIISGTYSELNAMRAGGKLVPGQYYRLTNYTLVLPSNYRKSWTSSHSIPDWRPQWTRLSTSGRITYTSESHNFDLILLAISTNEFSSNARAIQHSSNSSDYFANNDLFKWEIKYHFDNVTAQSLYDWTNTNDGKGVIYYMKDEFGNEAPYDFKNLYITFELQTGSSSYTPTFSGYTFDAGGSDLTVGSGNVLCYNNTIEGNTKYAVKQYLPSIILSQISTSSTSIYDNKIGTGVQAVILRKLNTTDAAIRGNVIMEGCLGVELLGGASYNFIGPYSELIWVDSGSTGNVIGNECWNIVMGTDNTYNTLYPTCNNIKLGNNCFKNTFLTYCRYIFFQDYIEQCLFENGVHHINKSSTTNNNYLMNCRFESGVSFINFYEEQESQYASEYIICATVNCGVWGTSSSYTTINPSRNDYGHRYRRSAQSDITVS